MRSIGVVGSFVYWFNEDHIKLNVTNAKEAVEGDRLCSGGDSRPPSVACKE